MVEVVDGLIRDVHGSRGPAVRDHERPSDQVMDLLRPFIDLFEMHQDLARSYGGILIRGKCSSEVFGALADQLIWEIHEVLTSAGAVASDALRGAEAIHLTYLGALFRWSSSGTAATSMDITMLEKSVRHICEGTVR